MEGVSTLNCPQRTEMPEAMRWVVNHKNLRVKLGVGLVCLQVELHVRHALLSLFLGRNVKRSWNAQSSVSSSLIFFLFFTFFVCIERGKDWN